MTGKLLFDKLDLPLLHATLSCLNQQEAFFLHDGHFPGTLPSQIGRLTVGNDDSCSHYCISPSSDHLKSDFHFFCILGWGNRP
jgi:hypothetical protein